MMSCSSCFGNIKDDETVRAIVKGRAGDPSTWDFTGEVYHLTCDVDIMGDEEEDA